MSVAGKGWVMVKFRNGRTEVACRVAAPATRVWEIITDTHVWPVWGPSVIEVECKERYIRGSSKGRVKTAVGVWLPFKVTEFNAGRSWSWSVAGISATGHRVELVDDSSCRLVFDMPWFGAPYGIVCRIALQRIKRLAENT